MLLNSPEMVAKAQMAEALFPNLPKGYYAVQADEDKPVQFIRVSFPQTGTYRGYQKVQSQHGDRLENGVLIDPRGRVHVRRAAVLEAGMLIVADPIGAAIRYALLIGNCCRCNATLTDARSRYYGIGPECEGYWPGFTERVDEMRELEAFESGDGQ